MFNRIAIAISLACFSIPGFLEAKDLGVYSAVFEIKEPDLLAQIEEKLTTLESQGALGEAQAQFKRNIAGQIIRPRPVIGVLKATKTGIKKFDPTVVLEDDIVIPGFATIAKGTKVNPLNYMNFGDTLVFINGDDDEQVEFAMGIFDTNPSAIIMLIKGEPGVKSKNDKEYFFFFDQRGIYCKRFGIKHVPSVVYQIQGEKVITIKEVLL